jgi:hypothetical protein
MAVRFFHNGQKQAAAHCAKTILHLTQFGADEEPAGRRAVLKRKQFPMPER